MSNVSLIPGFVSLSFYVLIILSVTDLVLSCGFARLYERVTPPRREQSRMSK